MHTRLPACSRNIGMNQKGSRAVSRGAVEKTSMRLGASRYSDMPVRARNSTRRVTVLTAGNYPRKEEPPASCGRFQNRPHQDGQGYVP
jgi:hypothetical protein